MNSTHTPSPAAESADSPGFPSPAMLEPHPDSAPDDEPWPAPASEYRGIYGHMPDLVDPLDPRHPETSFTQTRRLRHDGWSPEKMRLFHERLAECGVVLEACEAAGVDADRASTARSARDPRYRDSFRSGVGRARGAHPSRRPLRRSCVGVTLV